MKSLGKHLIIELFDCDGSLLDDVVGFEALMLEAVTRSGATIIQPVFHKFSPHGITGVVVVAESHFAVHTWPEYGYCAVDIFTCGEQVDGEAALEVLKARLTPGHCAVMELKRGMLDLPASALRHKPGAD